MHLSASFLVASSVAGLVTAVPAASKANGVKFSVQLIPANTSSTISPALMVEQAYLKFAKIPPSPIKSAAATARSVAGATGQVSASDVQYDDAYIVPVNVGGQTLKLDLDTGSSDLWVFSNSQPARQQQGHDIYKPGPAATRLPGETWNIGYGDGSAAGGIVYADQVVVGGVTATRQAVEAATSVTNDFVQDTTNDGLIGMGFSNINTCIPVQQKTFFDNIKATLAAALFTSSLKHNAPGSYDFGYIDPTKYTGNITYVPVNPSNGYWEFGAGSYAVGNTKFTGTVGNAIADTGTTLMYVPAKMCTNYYAQVPGAKLSASQGGWIYPCATALPQLQVTIGGTVFTIPGSYMGFAPVAGNWCFGGLQENTGMGFSIFGDTFLKSVFVVWDQTQATPRLGFAKQA